MMNPTRLIATASARPFTPRLNRHKGNQRSSAECGHSNSRVSSAASIYNNPTTPYSCCQVVQRMGSTSQVEPARHGAFGDAAVLGHGTDRPVGRIGRGRLQRRVDDLGHPFVFVGAGTSRAQLVVQSGQALRKEAPAPFADGEWTQPKALRAMEAFVSPSAQARTICARRTMPWGSERELARVSNWAWSSLPRARGERVRPRGMSVLRSMKRLPII